MTVLMTATSQAGPSIFPKTKYNLPNARTSLTLFRPGLFGLRTAEGGGAIRPPKNPFLGVPFVGCNFGSNIVRNKIKTVLESLDHALSNHI